MTTQLRARGISLLCKTPAGGEKAILDGIDATFLAGRMALISGETGAGKTTLLCILACMLRPHEGEILCDNEPVSRWISSHKDRWRRNVGFVFQEPRLFTDLTVLENTMLPLVPLDLPIWRIRKLATQALKQLAMGHLSGTRARDLSGGEAQRAGMARAIVNNPDILLADEPTAHQDREHADLIIQILERFKSRKAVVVVAAHDSRIQDHPGFQDRYLLNGHRLARELP